MLYAISAFPLSSPQVCVILTFPMGLRAYLNPNDRDGGGIGKCLSRSSSCFHQDLDIEHTTANKHELVSLRHRRFSNKPCSPPRDSNRPASWLGQPWSLSLKQHQSSFPTVQSHLRTRRAPSHKLAYRTLSGRLAIQLSWAISRQGHSEASTAQVWRKHCTTHSDTPT